MRTDSVPLAQKALARKYSHAVVFLLVGIACLASCLGRANLQRGFISRTGLAGNPRVREASASYEKLIILREKALYELARDSHTHKWKERKLLDFGNVPGRRESFSGPLVFPSGDILVCRLEQDGQLELYRWKPRQKGLSPTAVFRVEGSAGPGIKLDSWVPPENLFSMTMPITEGLAAWTTVKLLPAGKVAVGKEADASESTVLHRLGPRHFLSGEAYSPDGSLFAAGSGKGMAIYNRRSGKLRFVRVPLSYLWALSISDDSKAIAWIAEVNPRKEPTEEGMDYLPNVDAFGILWLDTGKTSVWRIGKVKGAPAGGTFWDQSSARIRLNKAKDALYFFYKGLMRFDIRTQSLETVPGEVDGFALVNAQRNTNNE